MATDDANRYVTKLDKAGMERAVRSMYGRPSAWFDAARDQGRIGAAVSLESFDELARRDKERVADGFPRKIRWRKVLVAPGKVITIPYVEEGQLVHGRFEPKLITLSNGAELREPDIGENPGSGDGEVGDVIGRVPVGRGGDGDDGDGDEEGEGDGTKPGAGDDSGEHLEEEAYDLGKRLVERLKLPNLKDKIKKFPTDEYTYDLTDRHRGSGQVLDKKETLRRMLKTNLVLGRISRDDLDPTKMVIGPDDRVYRVLSREKVWKSQAVVFFVRDYSISMWGEPTRALVSQHLMIYAWLLVQYEKRVTPRFFVHDTEAREVTAQQYFSLGAGGGTYIPAAYQEINNIVEGEGLASAYNIYLFQGTDGDDGDDGSVAIPELKKILGYVSRMGVTLFKHPFYGNNKTIFEEYVESGGILERRDVFRMHVMPYWNVTDEMNIAALKALIAQD